MATTSFRDSFAGTSLIAGTGALAGRKPSASHAATTDRCCLVAPLGNCPSPFPPRAGTLSPPSSATPVRAVAEGEAAGPIGCARTRSSTQPVGWRDPDADPEMWLMETALFSTPPSAGGPHLRNLALLCPPTPTVPFFVAGRHACCACACRAQAGQMLGFNLVSSGARRFSCFHSAASALSKRFYIPFTARLPFTLAHVPLVFTDASEANASAGDLALGHFSWISSLFLREGNVEAGLGEIGLRSGVHRQPAGTLRHAARACAIQQPTQQQAAASSSSLLGACHQSHRALGPFQPVTAACTN